MEEVKYKCDVCKKPIVNSGLHWMRTLTVVGEESEYDGSAAGHSSFKKTFHVHNDCMEGIQRILENK